MRTKYNVVFKDLLIAITFSYGVLYILNCNMYMTKEVPTHILVLTLHNRLGKN